VDSKQAVEHGVLIGSRLAGRYELRGLLGQGGMADVYTAHDPVLGRNVAVKVLRGSLTKDPRSLARFRQEAEAAASLTHPNIVSLYDIGTEGDVPFIVMELVTGETLSEVIWRDAPLPPERVAEIGEAVADALAFSHAAGIVHRDIKPGNIMLTPWGHVKVVDFGISRALSRARLTASLELRGTAEYLSPEQANNEELDGRSDIYSLGAVLYELLTGRPPFEGDSPLAVAKMHAERDPVPVREVRPAVPQTLDAIVMQCLEKTPANRYQRAAQLAADLRRFRFDRTAITAPVPRSPATQSMEAERFAKRHRRRRRALGLGAVLGLVAAVVVAGLAFFGQTRSPAARARPPVIHAPSLLEAKASCDGAVKGRIELTWLQSPAPFVDGYVVYRGTSRGGPFEKLHLVTGRGTRTYADASLNTDSTFFYRVAATAGGRIGPPSPVVQATTPTLFSCLF
jgi:serine/threonine-protein kinase